MSWKSSVRGSMTIASYLDPNFNGKKVKVVGYSPSLNDLGPPNLFIPEGHTGTLTGLVEFASFAQELPADTCPIECMILVEVCWDNVNSWHDKFCDHGRKIYRYPCLIDIFMSSYKMPPNFLFFMDDDNIAFPEELQTFVQAFENTKADIITCAFKKMEDSNPFHWKLMKNY